MARKTNSYHSKILPMIDDTLTQESLCNFCDLNTEMTFT